MVFSDLYKGPRSPLSRLRHSMHGQPQSLLAADDVDPDWDPDLYSRDKAKQKEAVRRYLAEKVRNDWDFQWPPQPQQQQPSHHESSSDVSQLDSAALVTGSATAAESGPTPPSTSTTTNTSTTTTTASTAATSSVHETRAADDAAPKEEGDASDSDTASSYSTVSEDPRHFRARAEWSSEFSSEEDDGAIPAPRILQTLSLPAATAAAPASPRTALPLLPLPSSPFRFDSPDAVGQQIRANAIARKARARRQLRNEKEWNPGLACFEARRDAWTGARTVRVRPSRRKATDSAGPGSPDQQPVSPTSKRHFWRRSFSHRRDSVPSLTPLSPTATAHPVVVPATASVAAGTTAAPQQQEAMSSTPPQAPVSPAQAEQAHHQQQPAAVVDMATPSENVEAGAAGSGPKPAEKPAAATTERINSVSSEKPPTLVTLATNGSHGSAAVTSGSDGGVGSSRTSTSDQEQSLHDNHNNHHHRHHHHHHHHNHHPDRTLPVETLIPLPRPLLPPQNPMRAAITPSMYNTIYDKVVVHSVQPACPINLADMTRACVAGWKRDGEWPPKTTPTAQAMMFAPATSAAAAQIAHGQLQRLHQAPVVVAGEQQRYSVDSSALAMRKKKKARETAAAANAVVVGPNGAFSPAAAKPDPAAATTTPAVATAPSSPVSPSATAEHQRERRRLSLIELLSGAGRASVERRSSNPGEAAAEEHDHHDQGAGKSFRRSLQRVLKIGKPGDDNVGGDAESAVARRASVPGA